VTVRPVDIKERDFALSNGRRARAFYPATLDGSCPVGLSDQRVKDSFADDEDAERLALIRATLEKDFVRVDAHEGIDPADVWGLYLHTNDGRLFLTKMIPRPRVTRMLQAGAESFVVETATMQVCESERPAELRAAFDRWLQRVFPDVPSPVYELNIGGEESLGPGGVVPEAVDVEVVNGAHLAPRQTVNAYAPGP